MHILLWATEKNVVKQRILNLKRSDEDFTFCSKRPTNTHFKDRVFFMDKGGIVYGFATYEKYEYAKVEHNIEGQSQEGLAIFFVGPFVSLLHPLPKSVWPRGRWRYIKGEVENYL